jgi:hypothetical protein
MRSRLGAGATVVTLLVDSGLKYLSTGLYRRETVIPRSVPGGGAQS